MRKGKVDKEKALYELYRKIALKYGRLNDKEFIERSNRSTFSRLLLKHHPDIASELKEETLQQQIRRNFLGEEIGESKVLRLNAMMDTCFPEMESKRKALQSIFLNKKDDQSSENNNVYLIKGTHHEIQMIKNTDIETYGSDEKAIAYLHNFYKNSGYSVRTVNEKQIDNTGLHVIIGSPTSNLCARNIQGLPENPTNEYNTGKEKIFLHWLFIKNSTWINKVSSFQGSTSPWIETQNLIVKTTGGKIYSPVGSDTRVNTFNWDFLKNALKEDYLLITKLPNLIWIAGAHGPATTSIEKIMDLPIITLSELATFCDENDYYQILFEVPNIKHRSIGNNHLSIGMELGKVLYEPLKTE